MQSAREWGEDDCAIMSSLISFSQADDQAWWWGWFWRDARSHGMDKSMAKYHGCHRFTAEKTGVSPEQHQHWTQEVRRVWNGWLVDRKKKQEIIKWQLKVSFRLESTLQWKHTTPSNHHLNKCCSLYGGSYNHWSRSLFVNRNYSQCHFNYNFQTRAAQWFS